MFYCTPCGSARGWPTDELMLMLGGSYGHCELCRKRAECFNVPSSQLPLPPGTPPLKPRDRSGDRYFIKTPSDRDYREVDKDQYVNAERRAGFHNTMGLPTEPATSSFGGADGTSGRIEYDTTR